MDSIHVTIGQRGNIRLPLSFRKSAGIGEGCRLTMRVRDDKTIEIRKFSDALAEVRAWIRKYDTNPATSLDEELKAMRQADSEKDQY